MAISESDMRNLRKELVDAIKSETHEAIKHTGHSWIEEAVRKITPVAIHETLITLGIQPEPPFESQRDFAYLRQIRVESEDTRKVIKKTLTTYLINGFLTLLVSGVASWAMIKALSVKVS